MGTTGTVDIRLKFVMLAMLATPAWKDINKQHDEKVIPWPLVGRETRKPAPGLGS